MYIIVVFIILEIRTIIIVYCTFNIKIRKFIKDKMIKKGELVRVHIKKKKEGGNISSSFVYKLITWVS